MTTAIRAGTLIDGTGADPRREAVVVVEDGVIRDVAKVVPRGAAVVDLASLTVLPGLIDCHVHLAITPRASRSGCSRRSA